MNAFFGGTWAGMAMINDLDRHVVDRFLAAPASRLAIVLSQVVRAGITAILQAIVLLLVGLALGVRVHGGALGWLVVLAAAFLLAMVFAGFSNGIALLLRREASMIASANFVSLPLMFLSSILVATALMPGWIRAIARFNPVNWGVLASRNAVVTGGDWGHSSLYLLFLLAAVTATSLFATWCFRSYQRSMLELRRPAADRLLAREHRLRSQAGRVLASRAGKLLRVTARTGAPAPRRADPHGRRRVLVGRGAPQLYVKPAQGESRDRAASVTSARGALAEHAS